MSDKPNITEAWQRYYHNVEGFRSKLLQYIQIMREHQNTIHRLAPQPRDERFYEQHIPPTDPFYTIQCPISSPGWDAIATTQDGAVNGLAHLLFGEKTGGRYWINHSLGNDDDVEWGNSLIPLIQPLYKELQATAKRVVERLKVDRITPKSKRLVEARSEAIKDFVAASAEFKPVLDEMASRKKPHKSLLSPTPISDIDLSDKHLMVLVGLDTDYQPPAEIKRVDRIIILTDDEYQKTLLHGRIIHTVSYDNVPLTKSFTKLYTKDVILPKIVMCYKTHKALVDYHKQTLLSIDWS
jgi:hypothetical protein